MSFRVADLLESVCVSDTALVSMAGHGAPTSWRVVQARHRQIINDSGTRVPAIIRLLQAWKGGGRAAWLVVR